MGNVHYEPQMYNIAGRVDNPARLIQCIQCHNEEEFIGLTLESIYDEVDRIIVIEGAVENRPNATDDGHSIDRTNEIIDDFKANHDPDNKLLVLRINRHWKNLEEIKQTFLDMCMDGDWIIINDADEFYKPEDIMRLRIAIDRYPHASEFIPTFLHFYRDFYHVAVPGPEWQPQHQRIFKYVRGMKYNAHPIVTDPAGHDTYFSPHYQYRRYIMNNFFIYHYGYARRDMDKIMRAKQSYYKGEIAKLGGADKKFDEKVKAWFDGTEPTLLFNGEHPKFLLFKNLIHVIMQDDHEQLIGVKYDDPPLWSEHELYSKVLANQPFGNIWLCMTGQAAPVMNFYHNGIFIE